MAKAKDMAWLKKHLFAVRVTLLVLIMLISSLYAVIWGWQRQNAEEPLILGVSYSVKYANELGIDWQRGFLAMLDELEIKHLRLMSYWDVVEPQNGQYDFADLDWQMDQAARHEATVVLAVGQRQPRWPECHLPDWATSLDGDEYKNEVLSYIETVVRRYENHPALVGWQLENEFANRLFGECEEMDSTFLEEELAVIYENDPDNPVAINASNQSGIPLREPVADRTGFSVYQHAYFEAFGSQRKWSFWYVPSWWHGMRAMMVESIHGGEERAFIHELQTEPWGPEATIRLSQEVQDELMDEDDIRGSVQFGIDTGMREIYLWGGEWWYWRLQKYNDKELWQTVKEIYQLSD